MSRKKQPKGLDTPIIGVEYVDPDKSRCEECGSSFGVHLMRCSKYHSPREGYICGACECAYDREGNCGCDPIGA